MNSPFTNSLPKENCTIVTKSYKKPKRRRHRNKFKDSNVKKKRLKKLFFTSKTHSYESNIRRYKLDSKKIMSDWYWSNYMKAIEWRDKHKIAQWKACALALLEENRYLIQIINNAMPGFDPEIPVTYQNLCGNTNYSNESIKQTSLFNFGSFNQNHCGSNSYEGDANAVTEEEDEENSDKEMNDSIEFEMSEEMIQFFEQSLQHKMCLKEIPEKELLDNAEQEVKEIQNNKLKRVTEMKLLYGEGASMITGMETSVQLSFDKYCDTKSPKYWPNIPFRL